MAGLQGRRTPKSRQTDIRGCWAASELELKAAPVLPNEDKGARAPGLRSEPSLSGSPTEHTHCSVAMAQETQAVFKSLREESVPLI